jgi:hypothetical protein
MPMASFGSALRIATLMAQALMLVFTIPAVVSRRMSRNGLSYKPGRPRSRVTSKTVSNQSRCLNTTYDGRIQHQPDHAQNTRPLQGRLQENPTPEIHRPENQGRRESSPPPAQKARKDQPAIQPDTRKEQGMPTQPCNPAGRYYMVVPSIVRNSLFRLGSMPTFRRVASDA